MKKVMLTLSFVIAVAFSACDGGDDDGTSKDAGMAPDGGTTEYVCDPALDTPRGMLLNAPLDPSVEVIEKTPTHPGDPGPDGLP